MDRQHQASTQRRQWLKRVAVTALPWAQVDGTIAAPAPDTPFAKVLTRARTSFLAEGGYGEAQRFLASQAKDGSWDDVDYANHGVGEWRALPHLERLRRIARAMAEPGGPAVPAKAGQAALNRGLKAWLQRKPKSENWWFNTIGQQRELVRILVLCGPLIEDSVATAAIQLLHDPGMVPAEHATGQNLTWYAMQQILRGALLGNATDLLQASSAVAGTLLTTLAEGVQPDFSFHQHGAQLYTGGYGLGFLQDNVQLATWLTATPWAVPEAGIALLANYALKGMMPLTWGTKWLDWSARGREFTRAERVPRPKLVRVALLELAPLTPKHGGDLLASAQRLETGAPPMAVTNHAFWRSDFMAHQTPNGYLSVKMCSARTIGTESGNGENLLGFWLPFGLTYVLKRGDEYDGLPPVWDWSALPGVTAPAQTPALKGYQRHGERFAGVVSDGRSGVAAMRLDKLQTRARKAWFFHGGTMVALGTDIHSQQDQVVNTCLNQARWRGPVVSDKGPKTDASADMPLLGHRWVWMDGVTYWLIDASTAVLRLEEREALPTRINTALQGIGNVKAPVFKLSISHGVRPNAARYAYGISLDADQPGMVAQLAASQWPDVLENSAALQAVWQAADLVQAVFHQQGKLTLGPSEELVVSGACLVQARRVGQRWQFDFSEPTGLLAKMQVELRARAGEPVIAQIAFPISASEVRQVRWAPNYR
jgi:chondroitin AC lyase